ncbi:hypothetical protein ABFS82_04G156400 [Erythranthe guttata]
MDSNISSAGLINIVNKAANLVSLILWCIFHSWIIAFLDVYYFFRRIFQLFSYVFLGAWKSATCHFPRKTAGDEKIVVLTVRPPCVAVSRQDVQIVMENLGLEGSTTFGEIAINMFDEREASLDEVREAFGLFDENNDGYIDADELNRVISSIGLTGFSQRHCKSMIMAFDENCDGRIDFGEFVKILEECSC